MLKFIATLLAISTLSATTVCAHAEDNGSVTQDSTSTTVVSGDGNNSAHISDQRARQSQQGHTRIIQRIIQSENTQGHDNDTQMNSRQNVDMRSHPSRN